MLTLNCAFAGLKLSSQDDDLQRAKLYLLIDLDKIQEALALINQGKSDVSQKFAYEKVGHSATISMN